MKKIISLILVLVMVLVFAGCGKQDDVTTNEVRNPENVHAVYDFPEPTWHIVVNYEQEGKSGSFEVGTEEYSKDSMVETDPVVNWFYNLEIEPESISKEEIKQADEKELFTFIVNGEEAFWFDKRSDKGYLCVDDKYYVVNNPSDPIAESKQTEKE